MVYGIKIDTIESNFQIEKKYEEKEKTNFYRC